MNTSVPSGSKVTIVMTGPQGIAKTIQAVQDNGGPGGDAQGGSASLNAQYVMTFTVTGNPGDSYTVRGHLLGPNTTYLATCTGKFYVG